MYSLHPETNLLEFPRRRWHRRPEVGEDDAMEVHDVAPALQARLGPDATAGLLTLLDAARDEWADDVTAVAVERFERRLTEEISAVRVGMAQYDAALRVEMGRLREELRAEIRQVEASLRRETADLRFDLLKWSFAFWIGQVIAVAGIMGLMIRLTSA